MISPDPIHACWEGSNGFCVAGATISIPDKKNVFDKRNVVVESMGCRGGGGEIFDKRNVLY